MESIEFKSLDELYNRVKPALYSKLKEMYRLGYKIVCEKDIWNYLVDTRWSNTKHLELSDLVSDILHVDNYTVYDRVLSTLKSKKESIDSSIL